MAAESSHLNQRLATVVAGYLCVGEGGERLWRRPDGTYIAHCPNFESGERWEDLERGLRRAGMLKSVQDRLGQELEVLHSTVHWRQALLTILDVLSADSRVVQAERATLSVLGFEFESVTDTTDRRVVLGALRRVRATLSIPQQLVFFDRPTSCRDVAGQFWLAYQTYASRSDVTPLLEILPVHGLEGLVLEVPPFTPAVRLLLIRAVPVPATLA
ncbi:hypothetical protein V3W47_08550 [Deinococcus sp. YIM 134068]|uniref:hypothetical protein n=1 Tax=Deinococcus lichenicola TaxID=3118910 RepID=UPI002F93AC99